MKNRLNKCNFLKLAFILLTGVFSLGACGEQSENDVKTNTGKDDIKTEAKYGYRVKEFSLQELSANVSCLTEGEIFFTENWYGYDEEGALCVQSDLYQYSWEISETPEKLGEIPGALCMAEDGQGNLYLLSKEETGDASEVRIEKISCAKGEILDTITLTDVEISSLCGMEVTESALLLWSGSRVYAFDFLGKELWRLDEQGEILDIACKDGEALICLIAEQDYGTSFLTVDVLSGKINSRQDTASYYDIEKIAYGEDGTVWCVGGHTGLSLYNLAENTFETVFEWAEGGIGELTINAVGSVKEKSVSVSAALQSTGQNMVYQISYGQLPEEGTKQDIIFSMQWLDDATKRAIVQFNMNNEKYRIVPETCAQGELYADYCRKTDLAIVSGKGADIFLLPPESYDAYLEKGLLLDIAPLLDKDETVKREDYVEEVWNIYSNEDAIYALPTQFTLASMTARADSMFRMGKEAGEGWTVWEMMEAVERLPEISEVITAYGKTDVFLYCCRQSIADGNREVFSQDSLVKLLEFANRYGCSEARMQYFNDGQFYHVPEAINLLMPMSINSLENISRCRTLWNGDFCNAGYPSAEKTPGYLYPLNSIAFRGDTPYAEAAWEFVKILLLQESQEQCYSFPVLKSALQERLDVAAASTERKPVGGILVGSDYLEVLSPGKEDVEFFEKLLEESVPYPADVEPLCAILEEEAAPYFAGDKSAEDVATVILNRMNLYWEEGN